MAPQSRGPRTLVRRDFVGCPGLVQFSRGDRVFLDLLRQSVHTIPDVAAVQLSMTTCAHVVDVWFCLIVIEGDGIIRESWRLGRIRKTVLSRGNDLTITAHSLQFCSLPIATCSTISR
ncbi:hypothetical protein K440DRAFT_140089 [Wilcoxina mikolae CBS 423.85]|nr:hypothetical protein K440DRAFT_140089 [Wilcoxina mikolae CBS 423.85]